MTLTHEKNLFPTVITAKKNPVPSESKATQGIRPVQASDHFISPNFVREWRYLCVALHFLHTIWSKATLTSIVICAVKKLIFHSSAVVETLSLSTVDSSWSLYTTVLSSCSAASLASLTKVLGLTENVNFGSILWISQFASYLHLLRPTQIAQWAKNYATVLTRAAHWTTSSCGPHIEWLSLILAN